MPNNATELTQRLLRALDTNYNVVDMPAVVEIISLLEKVAVTKELLETTRLGRHVNQLRRSTRDETLARRAKELVKKWRDIFLPTVTAPPDANGQLPSTKSAAPAPPPTLAPPPPTPALDPRDEPPTTPTKKRPLRDTSLVDTPTPKRPRLNGQMGVAGSVELELSDNSNSSFKDVAAAIVPDAAAAAHASLDAAETASACTALPPTEPKKRGRKKGSKNHRNLLEEAESSFSNKLNSSRGNARVKTTQELLADLQIKSSALAATPSSHRPLEDLNEKAAKLTQRVSIIDQKLNANSTRFRYGLGKRHVNVIESGVVTNVRRGDGDGPATQASLKRDDTDEEVIVVDDVDDEEVPNEVDAPNSVEAAPPTVPALPKSLTIEEARALLPPLDPSVLERCDEEDAMPPCTCQLIETDFACVAAEGEGPGSVAVSGSRSYTLRDDAECGARAHLCAKYRRDPHLLDEQVTRLHELYLPNINGNWSVGGAGQPAAATPLTADGLYVNLVPDVFRDRMPKSTSTCADSNWTRTASENFQKYSISERGTGEAEGGALTNNNVDDGFGVDGARARTDLGAPTQAAAQSHVIDEGGGGGGVKSETIVKDEPIDAIEEQVPVDAAAAPVKQLETFREWHEVVEVPSYHGDILRILPYVIID